MVSAISRFKGGAARGESVSERWRTRLEFDTLEDRDVPAATALPATTLFTHPGAAPVKTLIPPTMMVNGVFAPPSALIANLNALANASAALRMTPVIPPAPAALPPVPGPIPVNQYPDGSEEHRPALELRDVPTQMTISANETLILLPEADYGGQPAEHPVFTIAPVEGADFPEGASIDPECGEITWSPTPGYYAFEIRVQDGNNTASEIVHLRVEEMPSETLP